MRVLFRRITCALVFALSAQGCDKGSAPRDAPKPAGEARAASAEDEGEGGEGPLSVEAWAPQPDPERVARMRKQSDVSGDETVLLYPTWLAWEATKDGRAQWRGRLHGRIFEREEDDEIRGILIEQLRGALGTEALPLQSQILEQRIRPFLYDDERGEEVPVVVLDQVLQPRDSNPSGLFEVDLRINVDLAPPDSVVRKQAQALTPEDDPREFKGELFLLPAEGTLVISDIDDTIKHSFVNDRLALLRMTFLEPFDFVEGMAARYRGWLGPRDHLHFVSASPWQLFEVLREGVEAEGFPDATWSMREVRMDVVDLAKLAKHTGSGSIKGPAIIQLLDRLPSWRVVLVGDSGESDPEVYGDMARRYPQQVHRIFIRDVTDEARESARYQKAFEGVDPQKWMLFETADQLPARLD